VNRINGNFSALVGKALDDLRSVGFKKEDIEVIRSLDMRYRYQVHELNVPLPSGVSELSPNEMEEAYARFDHLYEQSFGPGSAYREVGKEIMNFRLMAIGALQKPRIRSYPLRKTSPDHALKGKREVYFEENKEFVPAKIYDFGRMTPGTEILGPAIVETPITTIVVNPNDRALVDEFLNVRIYIGL
jgi:N-methylhydantoinase A